MSAIEIIEHALTRRVAFISRNRFLLGAIAGLHISRLIRRGYDHICIYDQWGLREEALLFGGSLSREDLSRISYSCDNPHIIYSPWVSLAGKRIIEKALGIYTDGGRAILTSKGLYSVSLRPMGYRYNNYIVETIDGKIGYLSIDKDGLRDMSIPSKHAIAYQRFLEAFKIYGPFKMIDAINILVRELGVDRAEARKLIGDLINMGIIAVSKGMLQPQGSLEDQEP